MSHPKFSIRPRPKEEPEALPKNDAYIKPEEAKAPSVNYSNFGSGDIKHSLKTSAQEALPKTVSSETLNHKFSENIHSPKPDRATQETHIPVYAPSFNNHVLFNFLSQIVRKQKEGLSKIHQ